MHRADRALSSVATRALELLDGFDPGHSSRAVESVHRMRQLLQDSAAPLLRTSYDPGHVTASAVVLSPDRDSVLLVYHERLQRWLQPGGHVEPDDASLVAAARREVFEETGFRVRDDPPARLVGVDVHEIPATHSEPLHYHYDFMFSLTPAGDRDTGAPEGRVVWCRVAELESYGVDEPLIRGVQRARRLDGS